MSVMDLVSQYTDGDYCLPHLLDSDENYKQYFYEAKEKGRYIILDNSVHELDRPYDSERLLYWVDQLKPNEFIVPDEINNPSKSIELAQIWSKIELPKETLKVAVVQGIYEADFTVSYGNYKDMGYEKIAFSYSSKVYTDVFPHPDKNLGRMMGRVKIISSLIEDGIIGKNDRVHLLGCALPNEFIYYKNISQIESIDTSNPVMAAVDGDTYGEWEYGLLGLNKKPHSNMNNCFNLSRLYCNTSFIEYNIKMFQKMNKL
jgi:hypothetical protein